VNADHKGSASQALGRAVAEVAEGILAPSRIRSWKNLLIYPRSLELGSKIEVSGQDKLLRKKESCPFHSKRDGKASVRVFLIDTG
jgi:hypothetical protein